MSNSFYRNTLIRIVTEVLDDNSDPVVCSEDYVYVYIRQPDGLVVSNDADIASKINLGSVDSNIATGLSTASNGTITLDYVFTQAGNYKYKFQINQPTSASLSRVVASTTGDINIQDDGIF